MPERKGDDGGRPASRGGLLWGTTPYPPAEPLGGALPDDGTWRTDGGDLPGPIAAFDPSITALGGAGATPVRACSTSVFPSAFPRTAKVDHERARGSRNAFGLGRILDHAAPGAVDAWRKRG